MRLPLVVLVALLMLAGCLGTPSPQPQPASEAKAQPAAAALPIENGSVAHAHDYWQGKERATLLDQDYPLSADNLSHDLLTFGVEQRPAVGGIVVRLPKGVTVYEGTGKLEFTPRWSDPTITGLTLRYRAFGASRYSALVPLASGTPFSLDVSPTMTDPPHAGASQWAFLVEATGPGGAGTAIGTLHVTISVVKTRNPVVMPPHPDLYAGNSSVTLMDQDGSISSLTPTTDPGGSAADRDFGFPIAHPVPPGTRSILVKLDVKKVTSQNPLSNPEATGLSYRPPDAPLSWPNAKLLKQDGASGLYKIDVGPDQGDSVYANASDWRLWPYHLEDAGGAPVYCVFWDCVSWQMDFHVKAIAFKTDAAASDWPASTRA